VLLFDVFQGDARAAATVGRQTIAGLGQDLSRLSDHHRPFNRIFELANVPGQSYIIISSRASRLIRSTAVGFLHVPVQKVFRQERIPACAASAAAGEAHDVEPVEEVFPKRRRGWPAPSRGWWRHDPEIGLHRLGAADR